MSRRKRIRRLDKIGEILAWLKNLPSLVVRLRRRVDIDREETEQWLAELARLIVQSPRIEQWAEAHRRAIWSGRQRAAAACEKLLDSQPYRLVHWREAAQHDQLSPILRRQRVDLNSPGRSASLRRNPCRRSSLGRRRLDRRLAHRPHRRPARPARVSGAIDRSGVERRSGRIGQYRFSSRRSSRPEETLPCGWPVAGTTGYEFLNQVEAILISPDGFARHRRTIPPHAPPSRSFCTTSRLGANAAFCAMISPLRSAAWRTRWCGWRKTADRRTSPALREGEGTASVVASAGVEEQGVAAFRGCRTSDGGQRAKRGCSLEPYPELTKRDFVDAIVEVITALPVYRTYVDSNDCTVSDADRSYVEIALDAARGSGRAAPEAIDFLGEVLLLGGRAASAGTRVARASELHPALPATDRPGGGEGNRRHGALRLRAAGLAERSRRRAASARRAGGEACIRQTSSERRRGPRRCCVSPRTIRNAPPTSGRGWTCSPNFPNCGRAGPALAAY